MKLVYKTDYSEVSDSFYFKRVKEPVLDINWHFHEEYELIYIIKGLGVRLVGDHFSNFSSGELVLVGANLPHLWRTTKNYHSVDRIIIKFKEMPGSVKLFSLPEFSDIRQLLFKSMDGISFGSETEMRVKKLIVGLEGELGAGRWVKLLAILNELSKSKDYITLSKPLIGPTVNVKDEVRFSKVMRFISENYRQDLTLDEIAGIASMTTQSFCRYFKKRTNKTYIQFLNEYRIGKASVLLIEKKLTVSEIAYETGFNAITNFNRAFKKFHNCSPVEYQRKYKNFVKV
jgi:AraC-like DNA-binding protein